MSVRVPSTSRFDRIAILTLLALALAIAGVIWWSGRAPVRPVALWPARGAADVSTRATMRAILNREVSATGGATLTLDPEHPGELRVQGNEVTFSPSAPLAPDTTYTATLHGDSLGRPLEWRFTTGRPRVSYLAPDDEGRWQLFAMPAEGGEATPLTREAVGVWDYAVSPDGALIAYAAERADGGSDLWLMDTRGNGHRPLVECPEAFCIGATWSPDGARLIYERDGVTAAGAPAQAPHLWVVDVATADGGAANNAAGAAAAEAAPLFPDPQEVAHSARFSADGEWLAYIAPDLRAMVVQRLNGAGYVLIPEPLGLPASWSPTANELLVSQIHIDTHDEVIIYRLLRVDAGSGRVSPVASADAADGVYATWSPDGRLVAYGRETSTAQTVVGRQLWVMDSAGGAPRALTGESGVQHGAPHWSPDGRYLLFSRYRLGEPGRLEGLQLLEVETGAQRPISTEGLWPAWLP